MFACEQANIVRQSRQLVTQSRVRPRIFGDAPAGVALQLRQLLTQQFGRRAGHAVRTAEFWQLLGFRVGAPARTDPATQSPAPPTGDLRVEVFRISPHPIAEHLRLVGKDEPAVAGVEVDLRNRPIDVSDDSLWVACRRPPEVTDHAVEIIDRLNLRWRWTVQHDGE